MHFFFKAQLEDNGASTALAMVSQYLPPDPILLKQSEGTLFSCTYSGALTVIHAVDIRQVVAMIPHNVNGRLRYFMFEQPGQDVTNLGGFVVGTADESDEDSEDNIN